MKTLALSIVAAGTLLLSGCGTTGLVGVLETAVIASSSAIAFCPLLDLGNVRRCLTYAELVNQDAQKSIQVAENTANTTTTQLAVQILPLWTNVASIPFPTKSQEIQSLQAAVTEIITLLRQYSGPKTLRGGVTKPPKPQVVKLKKSDLDRIYGEAADNLKKIPTIPTHEEHQEN